MKPQLLSHLEELAGNRGLVHVRGDVLIQELESTPELLAASLQSLESGGAIRILSPLPFLVIRLKKWSGKRADVGNSSATAYSYSKLSSNRLKDSYRPTSDDALMTEILETLGETDPTSFEGAIKNFSAEVIRKALDRVRKTRSLRKNRTALFRYLLTKLS